MACNPDEILLYIEGELAPADAARVRAHAAGCASCAELLASEQTLERALGSLGDLDCPEGFAAATVTRARCDLTHAVESPRERRKAAFATASLGGLALALLWPTGIFDPLVAALGPAPCITRCLVSGLANYVTGIFMVGRAVSRHVLETRAAMALALVALVALVVLLTVLVSQFHERSSGRDRQRPR